MKLIAVYVAFVLIGETIAYFIGRTVEHWSQSASLPVFLACFFVVFWAGLGASGPADGTQTRVTELHFRFFRNRPHG